MTATLLDVPGIGADRAKVLADNGIRSIEQLAGTAEADIAAVPGFGPVTARRVKQTAHELLLSLPGRDEEQGKKPGKKDKGRSGKGRKGRSKDRKRRKKDKKSKKSDKKRKKEKKKKKKRKGS